MDIKQCPPSVFLTMVVLSLTAYLGSISVAYTVGQWAAFPSKPFPITAVLFGIGVILLPILAAIDIFHSRISGRYLGLLTMFVWSGVALRVLTNQLAMPVSYTNYTIERAAMIIATGSALIGLASLIYRFGFGKKANDFFAKEI